MNTGHSQIWTHFFCIQTCFYCLFFQELSFLYSHSDQLPSFICIFSYSQGVLSESVFLTFLIFIPYFLPISTLTIVDQTPIISYLDHCPGLVIPQSFPNCSMSYCQINLFKTLFWLYHSSIQKPSVILHCQPKFSCSFVKHSRHSMTWFQPKFPALSPTALLYITFTLAKLKHLPFLKCALVPVSLPFALFKWFPSAYNFL